MSVMDVSQVQVGNSATALNNLVIKTDGAGGATIEQGVIGGGTNRTVLSVAVDGRITGKGLPFAGVVFSVTAGVLTVHSSFGLTLTRSSAGQYLVSPTFTWPTNYAATFNRIISTSNVNAISQFQKSNMLLYNVENNVATDVSGVAPSSALFFEV